MPRTMKVDGGYRIWCPGCQECHTLPTEAPYAPESWWGFNEDIEHPTFTPSLRVRGGGKPERVCHSFIRDGMIQFLPDCTHALVGQTMYLEDPTGKPLF